MGLGRYYRAYDDYEDEEDKEVSTFCSKILNSCFLYTYLGEDTKCL